MEPTGVEIYQVDAFTDTAFGGNPAAVCPLVGPALDRWMQSVAAEMNVSETAFTWPDGEGRHLRWFTPTVEVPLCGHATLATAHVLWTELGHDEPVLAFETASGTLRAEAQGGRIRLDLPAAAYSTPGVGQVDAAAVAIGAEITSAGRYGENLLVEIADAGQLRRLRPDIVAIERLDAQGLIVTSADPEVDYLVRYFAPRAGIPEDPVTGSAQCAAGPYWTERTGRRSFVAHQASARGGQLWVDVDADGGRVGVSGTAVTVLRGRLLAGVPG